MFNTRIHRAQGVILSVVLILCLSTSLGAQESQGSGDDTTADFESSIFGNSGADASKGANAGENPEAQDDLNSLLEGFDIPDSSGFDSLESSKKTEYLVGGSILADLSLSVLNDAQGYLANSGMKGKVFAKISIPRYGALYASASVSSAFFQAYLGEIEAPPALDPFKPQIALSELHYGFDIAKIVFFRLGNQLIAWGPSRVWSPVDFINLEKADSFAGIDSRLGKPGLRLHAPLPFGNLFGFADFSGLLTEAPGDLLFYGDPVQKVNLAGRFDITAGGFEFGASAYGGMNSQVRLGADFSGRLLGATVYGELAWAPEYSPYEDSLAASAGLSFNLDSRRKWSLSAEGFYNSRGEDLSGLDLLGFLALPSDRQNPLYQGMWYAYAAVQTSELFTSNLSMGLSSIVNFSDLSYNIRLTPTLSLSGIPPLSLAFSYAGGGENKAFTRFSGDNALSISVSTRMEF